MKKLFKTHWPLLLVFAAVAVLFKDMFIRGLLPIPSDTIIGLYHPFRDLYAAEFPRGIPFQNSLITDPVRQIIPWKMLVVDQLSKGQLPIWNPYEMAGKPLLANFQSGVFYPLNIFLFIKPLFTVEENPLFFSLLSKRMDVLYFCSNSCTNFFSSS